MKITKRHIKWVSTALLLVIMGLATAIGAMAVTDVCYQEQANESGSCGYSINTTANPNPYTEVSCGIAFGKCLNVEYLKPTELFFNKTAAYGAVWQIKHGLFNTTNVTLPQACFDAYPDKVVVRLESVEAYDSYMKCWNGAGYTTVSGVDGSAPVSTFNNTATFDLMVDGDYNTRAGYLIPSWYTDNNVTTSGFIYEEGLFWNITSVPVTVYAAVYGVDVLDGVCFASDPSFNPAFQESWGNYPQFTYDYEWYKNGVVVKNGTTGLITSRRPMISDTYSDVSHGDEVIFSCRANEVLTGQWVNSTEILITTDDEICYQENGTDDEDCGAVGNPNYFNWTQKGSTGAFFHLNYTKPERATGMIWQVKPLYGPNSTSATPFNITIPSHCFNYDPDNVLLTVELHNNDAPFGWHLAFFCYNGTAQSNLDDRPYNPGAGIDNTLLYWVHAPETFSFGFNPVDQVPNASRAYDADYSTAVFSVNNDLYHTVGTNARYTGFYEEAAYWTIEPEPVVPEPPSSPSGGSDGSVSGYIVDDNGTVVGVAAGEAILIFPEESPFLSIAGGSSFDVKSWLENLWPKIKGWFVK